MQHLAKLLQRVLLILRQLPRQHAPHSHRHVPGSFGHRSHIERNLLPVMRPAGNVTGGEQGLRLWGCGAHFGHHKVVHKVECHLSTVQERQRVQQRQGSANQMYAMRCAKSFEDIFHTLLALLLLLLSIHVMGSSYCLYSITHCTCCA